MARINFEDSVYKNPFYAKLLLAVGDEYKTKGMLLTAWELAHTHWLDHQGIPLDKWPEELNPLIEFKFARTETRSSGTFVYVSGSKEHCSFLEAKARGGRKGGKSKSPQKLKNLRQYSKTPKQDRNTTESKPKLTESSYSYSSSNSIIPFSSKTGEVAALPPVDRNPVGLWIKAYNERYGVRYALGKQDAGMLTHAGKNQGLDRLEVLFACYLAIKEPLYENAKHPLSLFFRDLQKVSVAAQTGIDPSKQTFDYSKLKD